MAGLRRMSCDDGVHFEACLVTNHLMLSLVGDPRDEFRRHMTEFWRRPSRICSYDMVGKARRFQARSQ